ncbi:hypothetical protein [Photobacterium carnosum]|uniref:hypothetical protein n=1 Tax=Photobacterium carnosum TaxID=2023717 RepID=UPI001E51157A|nr:hypothetical protein [Photobacterium carnosum]MCD9494381.1 hypothetical protein [Photobacterium carnosum]
MKKHGLIANHAKQLGQQDVKATDSKESCSLERTVYITNLPWKEAKPVLDKMDNETMRCFEKHAGSLKLKKVAWQNYRVSMHTYARIKNKAEELNLTATQLIDFLLDQV